MSKTSVESPPPRNYAQETRDNLRAQIDLAPELYENEAKYQPLYNELGLRNFQALAPTMLDFYKNSVTPMMLENQNAQRRSDVAAATEFAPRVGDAMRSANPQRERLLGTLNADATAEIGYGGGLNPLEQRNLDNQFNAQLGQSGFAGSPGSAAKRALGELAYSRDVRNSRQNYATGVAQLNQGAAVDPWGAILGQPSQSFSQGQQIAGTAGGIGQSGSPHLFNPESGYGADIMNQGWQGKLAANTAEAANESALASAWIKGPSL